MQHLRGDVKICLSELTLVMEYLRKSNQSKAWMCGGGARYYSRLALVQLEGLVKDASTKHDNYIKHSEQIGFLDLKAAVRSIDLDLALGAMQLNIDTLVRRVNILDEYRNKNDAHPADATTSDGEVSK